MNDDDSLVTQLVLAGVNPVTAELIAVARAGTFISSAQSVISADLELLRRGVSETMLLAWAKKGVDTRDFPILLLEYSPDELNDAIDCGIYSMTLLKCASASVPYRAVRTAWQVTRGNHTWHLPIARLVGDHDLTDDDLELVSHLHLPAKALRSRAGIQLSQALDGATGLRRTAILVGTLRDGDVSDGLTLADRTDGYAWADIAIQFVRDGQDIETACRAAEALERAPKSDLTERAAPRLAAPSGRTVPARTRH